MNTDLDGIRRYVTSLVRRERTLLLARVVLRLGAVGGAVLALAGFAAAVHWDRPSAVASVVLVAGVGAWAAGAAPIAVGWRSAGDPLRQARLVEAIIPDLRGRLMVAVARLAAPAGPESPAMLGLVVQRASARIATAPPSRVHPPRAVIRPAFMAFVAWFVAAVVLVFSPLGPTGTAAWWLQGVLGAALGARSDVADEGETARVGDLVLRYVYPTYTGLDPHVVTNGTGDAHGPPGTIVEVTARSGDPIDTAAIVAYDDPALEAEVAAGGRGLTGQFTIGHDEGAWRILTWRGAEAAQSRRFRVIPEPDLPPEVQLDAAAATLEVAVDESIGLIWRARDDYGVSRVVIEVNGAEKGGALSRPLDRQAEVDGRAGVRPMDLGLAAGDRVTLDIAAWDNDAISGSKVGRSHTIEIVVLGKNGLDAAADARQLQLRTLMIEALAPFLVEPWPPGTTSGAMAAWGKTAGDRYRPITSWFETTWGDRHPRSRQEQLEVKLQGNVTAEGAKLVTFTQVAFNPGSAEAAKADDVATAEKMRDDAIVGLENAILLLDRMIQAAALERVQETAKTLGEVAREVKASLHDDMSAQEMLTRLDKMARTLKELDELASKLGESGLKEFVNQRDQEMTSLMDQIRTAIAEGRMDDAKAMMERLADQLDELAKGVEEQTQAHQQQESDEAKRAKELVSKLDSLEKEQRELQRQTQEISDKGDQAGAERAAKAWEELDQMALDHVASAEAYRTGLDAAKRVFNEVERAQNGVARSSHLKDAIAARDLRGARRAVSEAVQAWQYAEFTREMEAESRGGHLPGPGAGALSAMQDQLEAISAKLDQLEQQASKTDPATQQQAQQLKDRQDALQKKLDEAKGEAEQVAKGMSIKPEGMAENLGEAGEAMQQAGEDLGSGQPMPAAGSEGSAAQRIHEAKDSLEQAMRDQAASSPSGRGGKEQGQGEGEGKQQEGDDEGNAPDDIEIPNAMDFRTPEQYREELIEGMQGDVPDEYSALKKRYYEELVHP